MRFQDDLEKFAKIDKKDGKPPPAPPTLPVKPDKPVKPVIPPVIPDPPKPDPPKPVEPEKPVKPDEPVKPIVKPEKPIIKPDKPTPPTSTCRGTVTRATNLMRARKCQELCPEAKVYKDKFNGIQNDKRYKMYYNDCKRKGTPIPNGPVPPGSDNKPVVKPVVKPPVKPPGNKVTRQENLRRAQKCLKILPETFKDTKPPPIESDKVYIKAFKDC